MTIREHTRSENTKSMYSTTVCNTTIHECTKKQNKRMNDERMNSQTKARDAFDASDQPPRPGSPVTTMSPLCGSSLTGAGAAASACALAFAAARISARLASRALTLPAYDLSFSSSSLARASSATVASAPARNPTDVLSASRRVFASPSRAVARATTHFARAPRDGGDAFARVARGGVIARVGGVVAAVATVNDMSIVCARACGGVRRAPACDDRDASSCGGRVADEDDATRLEPNERFLQMNASVVV